MPKTLIAIPCMDMLHTQFAQSLINITRTAPQNTSVCFKQSSLIYDSRNLLYLTAFENGFDRILWLDSDMTFPIDTLTRLSTVMDDGNYDLVTGLYVKRKAPVKPILYKRLDAPDMRNKDVSRAIEDYLDYPRDSVFPIAGCGFGCVLTTVDLIRRVWDRYGPAFSPLPWCGEDIAFCYRAGRDNIKAKMVCDSSVKCGHIGSVIFTEDIFLKER